MSGRRIVRDGAGQLSFVEDTRTAEQRDADRRSATMAFRLRHLEARKRAGGAVDPAYEARVRAENG